MSKPTARDLCIHVYDKLLDGGRPPTISEIAEHFAISSTDSRRAIAEMKIGKTVLPDPNTGEIWMAGPFSAAPTAYPVIGVACSGSRIVRGTCWASRSSRAKKYASRRNAPIAARR